MNGREIRCLSFHASYACQNTGVCCGSGWRIDVERPIELRLRQRLPSVALELPRDIHGLDSTSEGPAGCSATLRIDRATRTCWFRDDRDQRCAIHRDLGEDVLPSACRQFPRVCVLEPDQISVSLSHYCPTAAHLLFANSAPFSMVVEPTAYPGTWPFEGLDARTHYSPLLRTGVLLGFDGLRAFEDAAVHALSSADDAEAAMRRIEGAVAFVDSWTPGHGSVPSRIVDAFRMETNSAPELVDPGTILPRSLAEPADITVPLPRSGVPGTTPISAAIDSALRRYLAARLVASWIMFQGAGLRTVARHLRLCLETARLFASAGPENVDEARRWKEAIRNADLWIVHYCDPELLAANLR